MDTKGAVTLGRKAPTKAAPKAKASARPDPKFVRDPNPGATSSLSRAPVATPKPAAFNRKGQVGFDQPKPVNATSKVASHATGSVQFGFRAAKGSPAITYLMIGTFVIVALAKIRGGLDALDIPKALFGGFILAFILTLLAQAAPSIALGFAALVFVGALLELGPKALGFSLTGKTTLPGGPAAPLGNTNSLAVNPNQIDPTQNAVGNSPQSVFY